MDGEIGREPRECYVIKGRIKGKMNEGSRVKSIKTCCAAWDGKLGVKNVAGRENECGRNKNAEMVLRGDKDRHEVRTELKK